MARRLALLIGNNEYDDTGFTPLTKPLQDVDTLAEVLRDPNLGHFDEVITFKNEPHHVLTEAIDDFFMVGKQRDDLLLLYFSGHGQKENGKLFLAAKNSKTRTLRSTAIKADFIKEVCQESGSKRQVIILDCCYSGAFGAKGATKADLAEAFDSGGHGAVVLAATSLSQEAMEIDEKLGQIPTSVFTHFLLEGLKTGAADSDRDGKIGVHELFHYISTRIQQETSRKQTPHKLDLAPATQDIIIAYNPQRSNPREALPKLLRLILDAPDLLTQKAVLAELIELIDDPAPPVQAAAHAELLRLSRESVHTRIRRMAAAALAEEEESQILAESKAVGFVGSASKPTALDSDKSKDLDSSKSKDLDSPPATPKTKIEFDWVTIPAGEFIMGSDDGHSDEKPQHKVYLPEYQVARVPVTNEQWGMFLQDSGYQWAGREKLWKDGLPRGKEKHPVVHVSWHDAMAFCEWVNTLTPNPSARANPYPQVVARG